MPKPDASNDRPRASVKSALPSASIMTLSPAPWSQPQASITKTSLTDPRAMLSTPLARMASACWMKPGRCLAEQVGVKAPGRAKTTTFLPPNSSSVETSLMPSAVFILSFVLGILSPTLIVMGASLRPSGLRNRPRPEPGHGRRDSATDIGRRRSAAKTPHHRISPLRGPLGETRRCRLGERRQHLLDAQQLRERPPLGRGGAIDDVERNAVAAEAG